MPELKDGFWPCVIGFGVTQSIATLSLSKALKLSGIAIVTSLWKLSLLFLVVFAYVTLDETPSAAGAGGRAAERRRRLSPQCAEEPHLGLGAAARAAGGPGSSLHPGGGFLLRAIGGFDQAADPSFRRLLRQPRGLPRCLPHGASAGAVPLCRPFPSHPAPRLRRSWPWGCARR